MLNAHPDRQSILQEIHARPFMPLEGRCRIFFLAYVGSEKNRQKRREDLDKLLTDGGYLVRFDSGMNVEAESGSWTMRWENHSEFSSFFFVAPLNELPITQPGLSCLPEMVIKTLDGGVFEAVDIVLTDEPDDGFAGAGPHFGSTLGSGGMGIRTSLKTDSQGFIRVFAHNMGEKPTGAGRKIQLFLELLIYQKLALLALPLARKFGPTLRSLDERVGTLARNMNAPDADDNELLSEIAGQVNEIEQVIAETTYRFSASRAYMDIVEQRLSQLRETRQSGVQTLKEFLERRLVPAMKTCSSVEERQAQLSVRTRTLADLLSARVNVSQEKNNTALLESMDRRAKLQLRLQETVEGLSIVAISYYGVGLTGYLWKMAKSLGLISDPALWTGLSLPPIILLIWLSVRRVRKKLTGE